MMIPIDGFDLKELLETLKAFPNGKVEVEGVKAYWNTTDRTPQAYVQQIQQPQQRPQSQQQNMFGNMKKALFEAFE